MSDIIKTEAVVLRKINQGDSSLIVTLFSPEHGKFSVIAKGIKSPKSKMNARLELFNHVEVVFYRKQNRDVQMIKSADTVTVHNKIIEDIDRYMYASGVLELFNKLLPDNEQHEKLFKGILRILKLFNLSEENPKLLFVRFFLFFIDELGYGLQLDNCSLSNKKLIDCNEVYYSYNEGFICDECGPDHLTNFNFSAELFNILICLSSKNVKISCSSDDLNFLINFLQKHLMCHVEQFRGLSSLKVFD
jgi:DNA repair protein RecO (recombination protein O)